MIIWGCWFLLYPWLYHGQMKFVAQRSQFSGSGASEAPCSEQPFHVFKVQSIASCRETMVV